MIAYADVFLQGGHGLPGALERELRRHFTPPQIVELTVCLALVMGFSKIAVALGAAPATMPTLVVPSPDLPE